MEKMEANIHLADSVHIKYKFVSLCGTDNATSPLCNDPPLRNKRVFHNVPKLGELLKR